MATNRNIRLSMPELLHVYMTDSSDNIVANADYSSAATEFSYITPAGKIAAIQRMIIAIGEDGNIATDKYGAADALVNGITLQVKDANGVNCSWINGTGSGQEPVHRTIDWAMHCYDFDLIDTGTGHNADYAMFRWTFGKAGIPIVLNAGESLVLTLNDDLRSLTDHRFLLQGVLATDALNVESQLVNVLSSAD